MQYMTHICVNDAAFAVEVLKKAGFKAFYQTMNSRRYEVRYWR